MSAPALLRTMKLIRAFEAALAARRDHGFQLLSAGEEAVAAGFCAALEPGDLLLTGGRSIGFALARGIAPRRLMAELLGRRDGVNAGRAGRGHVNDKESGFFGAHAVVGGNLTVAAGLALSRQLSGEGGIVAVVFGDGACGAGALHEALNLSALWRLPLAFVCDDNGYSVSTPRAAALAAKRLADLAAPFGIPSRRVDGMDVEAVADAAREAAEAARAGGPFFLECASARFLSHSTTARETRSKAELDALRARCPIAAYQRLLVERGDLDDGALAALDAEVAREVAEALAFADASPPPDPQEALADVW
ncbi:thiamine pyrophosphate-dependent dehydrogenase E1 component subunit alpha [Methylocella sp.]|uniref:thiamine pyrophosphate-dependent dehydrogenase E1 component subunit alpha n=1 Tax=Methylocella sp. TaxID=1978226 RepID=UPI00378501F0